MRLPLRVRASTNLKITKKKYDDMPSLLIFFAVVFLFSRIFIFVFLFSRIFFFVFVVFRVFFAGFFIGCIAHTGCILRENTSIFVTTHDACIHFFLETNRIRNPSPRIGRLYFITIRPHRHFLLMSFDPFPLALKTLVQNLYLNESYTT